MNEFFTVKALLNVWRQLNMNTYPSNSKMPVLSAARFVPIGCAYVYFAYLPDRGSFTVSLTYPKEGTRIEKEYRTTDIHKAMKVVYCYNEELNAL